MAKINKVLLVGLGSIGKRHLKNLQKLLPCATIGVLRSHQDASFVADYEIIASFETAIDFQPDMAVICTPSTFHMAAAKSLASQGVHLFIEKPLSNQVQGVDDFIEIIDHSKAKVMVGYNLRFSRSLREFKSLLDAQDYGRTLVVSAEVGQYLPTWRPDIDYRSTVSARSDLGGGALLELSHELDYLIWLFGKPVTVSAKMATVSDLEVDVEDLVLAYIDFDKSGCNLPVSVQLDFLQRQPYRRCKAVCEDGTLVWNAIAGRVDAHQQGGSSTVFQEKNNRNYTYKQEMQTFIDCIESGASVPIDAKDGFRVLELVEAIRQSSKSGNVVHL